MNPSPPTSITGGCYCGAVRFTARAPTLHQVNGHCANCRRAVGAQAVAWITVPRSALHFDSAPPRRYRTDTGAWRTFCDQCGTSLTFEHDTRPAEVDITVGSLDRPLALASADLAAEPGAWTRLADLPQPQAFPAQTPQRLGDRAAATETARSIGSRLRRSGSPGNRNPPRGRPSGLSLSSFPRPHPSSTL